jgi:hypothetical protein
VAFDCPQETEHSYVSKSGLQSVALNYAFTKLCIDMFLSLDYSQRLWIMPSGNRA